MRAASVVETLRFSSNAFQEIHVIHACFVANQSAGHRQMARLGAKVFFGRSRKRQLTGTATEIKSA
jgi:hypothetical protein